MERQLDQALKVLKLMKYGDRALADHPIKVALIVLACIVVNKLMDKGFDRFDEWLIRREERNEQRLIRQEEREFHQKQADFQLRRELALSAAAAPRN